MNLSLKTIAKFAFSALLILQLTGCPLLDYILGIKNETTEQTTEETPVVPEEITEEKTVLPPQDLIGVLEVEPKSEEPEPEPEPVAEEPEEPEVDEDEYLRSIDSLDVTESVTKTEFNEDKIAILTAITELSDIMETKDFNKWLTYIDPISVEYYSNPANLRKAQKKLPNKSITLRTIGDYFKYVFIPSRQRSQVDEIRYISKTNIKAVQVKEDKSIVVYYYFTKINGKWYVHLPVL